jgi:hypothetical protein
MDGVLTAPAATVIDVADAEPKIGVTKVGLVANTFSPVPVFVTLIKFLLASMPAALEAVKLEKMGATLNVATPVTPNVLCKVTAPATLAVVPTNSALAIPAPPAVMIDPEVVPVESVTRVELIPAAKGMRTVVVDCPSLVIAVDKPVAKSAVRALKAVEEMTVPATTGCPDVFIWNVPEPL